MLFMLSLSGDSVVCFVCNRLTVMEAGHTQNICNSGADDDQLMQFGILTKAIACKKFQ